MRSSIRIVGLVCLMLVFSLPALAGEKVIAKEPDYQKEAHVTFRFNPHPINVDIQVIREEHTPHLMALDWYRMGKDYGLGLKYQILTDLFATSNCEYNRYRDDLYFSLGAIYRIPKQVILWHFYIGGEYTFSRNIASGYPYVLIGTDFLFFFAESKYSLTPEAGPVYRSGLRFYF